MAGLTEWDLLPELLSLRFPVPGVWVSILLVLLPLLTSSGQGALCPSGISYAYCDCINYKNKCLIVLSLSMYKVKSAGSISIMCLSIFVLKIITVTYSKI